MHNNEDPATSPLPLQGVRVLELGSFIAAPQTARMLGDFGAEVIKVESPNGGDELRYWGDMIETDDGPLAIWWLSAARNKRLITLDLRQPAGQALVLRLIAHCDIVVENFRPGRLEGWNLDYDAMRAVNPRLVFVRISGYGQTGPYHDRACYGAVGESMGGLRYITGFPDRPPVRMGTSLGDELAAQKAAFGALLALRVAERTGQGQVVDVAITEAVFASTEAMLSEYVHLGHVRERTGNRLMRTAPSNVYQTSDGKWLAVGGNGENVFRRLAKMLGQPALADDPRYSTNQARIANNADLDEIIGAWVQSLPLADARAHLDAAGVPAGPVMSIADIAADPQFQARGMLAQVPDARMPDGVAVMSGIIPRLTATPGAIRSTGGALGADNDAVFQGLLGLSAEELAQLAQDGVIKSSVSG